jgi:hypothetical protein
MKGDITRRGGSGGCAVSLGCFAVEQYFWPEVKSLIHQKSRRFGAKEDAERANIVKETSDTRCRHVELEFLESRKCGWVAWTQRLTGVGVNEIPKPGKIGEAWGVY